MISITYFRSKCIGCNGCVEADPNRWRVSKKDGKSNLIDGKEKKGIYTAKVGYDELENLEAASKNCPAKIIKFNVKK
ncbi:MAG: ferredoxin [Ignavibacteriae bacterium]|nr:MAG: ferredoxin [Ignavibacteriota bacterium]